MNLPWKFISLLIAGGFNPVPSVFFNPKTEHLKEPDLVHWNQAEKKRNNTLFPGVKENSTS